MDSCQKIDKKDISCQEDIELLVNTFYDKVRRNKLLFEVFDPIIKDGWKPHLQKMIGFWSTLLLYTRQYKDDPLLKHLPLHLNKEHFKIWLSLFNDTVDDLFYGVIAENAKKRAFSIARIMKAVKNIKEEA
jgi:hemoglobin